MRKKNQRKINKTDLIPTRFILSWISKTPAQCDKIIEIVNKFTQLWPFSFMLDPNLCNYNPFRACFSFFLFFFGVFAKICGESLFVKNYPIQKTKPLNFFWTFWDVLSIIQPLHTIISASLPQVLLFNSGNFSVQVNSFKKKKKVFIKNASFSSL
jgi:hypothetical protein